MEHGEEDDLQEDVKEDVCFYSSHPRQLRVMRADSLSETRGDGAERVAQTPFLMYEYITRLLANMVGKSRRRKKKRALGQRGRGATLT